MYGAAAVVRLLVAAALAGIPFPTPPHVGAKQRCHCCVLWTKPCLGGKVPSTGEGSVLSARGTQMSCLMLAQSTLLGPVVADATALVESLFPVPATIATAQHHGLPREHPFSVPHLNGHSGLVS